MRAQDQVFALQLVADYFYLRPPLLNFEPSLDQVWGWVRGWVRQVCVWWWSPLVVCPEPVPPKTTNPWVGWFQGRGPGTG
jgi:hypothetical protein